MSNIKKTNVKNHLSPRFRAKLHLCEPQTQPTGAVKSGSMEKPLNLPSTEGREPLSIVTPKSVQD